MSKRAKSISVSQLKAAAKEAAEHAHRRHAKVRVEVEDLYLRPPIICGIVLPWPWDPWTVDGNPDQSGFIRAFTENLAANPALANAGVDGGRVQPAVYTVGGQTVVGVQVGGETFGA